MVRAPRALLLKSFAAELLALDGLRRISIRSKHLKTLFPLSLLLASLSCSEPAPNRSRAELTFKAVTQDIGHPEALWSVVDSAAWDRARDSVAASLKNIGARPLFCESDSRLEPRIRNTFHWWLPKFAVRLTAYPEKDHAVWIVRFDSLDLVKPC